MFEFEVDDSCIAVSSHIPVKTSLVDIKLVGKVQIQRVVSWILTEGSLLATFARVKLVELCLE
jgi:hypothetical protein